MATRKEIEEEIISRASTDPDFKERLLRDPKAAAEEVLGWELPDELKMEVHQEDMRTVHLVIPMVEDEFEVEFPKKLPAFWP